MKKFTSKIIPFLLIVIVLSPSLYFPKIAEAQSITNLVGSSAGPIAGALVSCKLNQTGGIGAMFDKDSTTGTGTGSGQNVPTSNGNLESMAKSIKEKTKSQSSKLTCTNYVEKAAAQIIIKQLTKSIVGWINNGFKGGKAIFAKDTKSLLDQVRYQSILDFSATLNNKELYPFAQNFKQWAFDTTQTYFERNAAYSLDKVIANNSGGRLSGSLNAKGLVGAFMGNFQNGGWAAFESSLMPNNNPIGFNFIAGSELSKKLENTGYSAAQDIKDQISRGEGFLDLKKCLNPENYDAKAYSDALKSGNSERINETSCKRWETQTPGSVAASQIDNALGSPLRQLEIGGDLSSAIAAIIDALVNKLVTTGLSALEKGDEDSSSFENNDSFITNDTETLDFSTLGNTSSGNYEEFNIFSDIPKLIAREKQVKEVLVEQNNIVTNKLIPAIYRLDYCIPGPHPGWEKDIQQNLKDEASLWPGAGSINFDFQDTAQKFLDPGGIFSGFASQIKDAEQAKKDRELLAEVIGESTGLDTEHSKTNHLPDIGAVATVMTSILHQYSVAIKKEFFTYDINDNSAFDMQLLFKQDDNEFKKIPKYKQGVEDNETDINQSDLLIVQLQRLQTRINALPNKSGFSNTGPSTPEALSEKYTNDIKPIATKSVTKIIQENPGNEYLPELKRIADLFSIISPEIYPEEEFTKQEALKDNLIDTVDEFTSRGGLINACKDIASNSSYNGDVGRLSYPFSLGTPIGSYDDVSSLPVNTYVGACVAQEANTSDGDIASKCSEGISATFTPYTPSMGKKTGYSLGMHVIGGPSFLPKYYYTGDTPILTNKDDAQDMYGNGVINTVALKEKYGFVYDAQGNPRPLSTLENLLKIY